jgi:hypothetical protein
MVLSQFFFSNFKYNPKIQIVQLTGEIPITEINPDLNPQGICATRATQAGIKKTMPWTWIDVA